jgi:hypothetical protein
MYNKNILLLKNFRDDVENVVKKNFINERTPFYFVSTIFLFSSIVLSFMSALYSKENFSDFFPNKGKYYNKDIHDNSVVDKICWYFSQITHHTIILLFFYFFLALINRKSEAYFKMIAPLALTISVLYFYFLFPKQRLSLHQLPYYNFFSHFMIIFLVFGELIYINKYTFEETTHCFIFILTCLCAIFINFSLRGVWSYNLVKLDRLSGWTLVSKTTIIMYCFSFLFYLCKSFFRNNNDEREIFMKSLMKSKMFFTGMFGLIFFNIFLYIDNKCNRSTNINSSSHKQVYNP